MAQETASEGGPSGLAGLVDPLNAFTFAFVAGAAIFVATTAVFYRIEQRRWAARERAMRDELAELRGAHDRAEILVGAESQIVVCWDGRDAEPRIEGDPSALGGGVGARRILAFGSWLTPADAAAIEGSIARLRERGEGFRTTLKANGERFVDAEGRALGGRAILRLRDVTGERADLMQIRRDLSRMRGDLDKLRALLDVVDQPVWLRDAEGRIAWANAAYLAAVEARDVDDARLRKLELLDKPAREKAAAHRKEGKRFTARLAAVVAGARRMLDVTETPSPGGAAGVAVDVSEVEEMRADLNRQMEAHVRTLDQLPTAVAIFDARQRLVFHNTSYRLLWKLDQPFLESGPTDGEILDRLRSLRKLPEQADFKSWKADVLGAYRSIEPRETWWHLPDGRVLRVVANPDPRGGLTYLFDDVSENIQLESSLNAVRRVQGETLDTLAEGVAVFGPDGRLRLANRAFARLWRMPETTIDENPHIDAVIAHCLRNAPAEEPWNEIRTAISGAAESRSGISLRMERRDGIVLDCAGQPLPDGATLLTFIDVTASVNVERALTEKNDALERAAQLRDEFVHHVSYELRSPLTTIIGFAQLLGDETVGELNARQREYAGHIMRSSGALLAIINDILDLASIDTGSLELSPEDVDVRETIDAAIRGLEDRIAEARLDLVVDAPAGVGSFRADGKRVRQVLFNLLSNAIGFSEPGERVTITARREGEEVLFTVTDRGRGIPEDVADRVFERFESHTRGSSHRGVGLGLSMVRSFVELHGGRVNLESAPGSGTTVTCAFPAEGPRRLAAE
ncbi:MAG: PAS domain-containing protein [Salinarimonadaceae bacterium]|nr:MAG: PAS domain-containing protein [Salinarimonadaceae bacterium]